MKPIKLIGACALALGMVLAVPAGEALAQDKGAKADKAAEPNGAPDTKKPINVWPKKLAWGMSPKQVAAIYDAIIDHDYRDDYKKVQPGVQMQQLDAEVDEKKSQFRRSIVKFGNVPTGVDATVLKGEYTYNNKESMMEITRNDKTRYFFFIGDRLWKIIDEHPVGGDSKWGSNFEAAVKKLANYYGSAGRVVAPNPAVDRRFAEVDWKDKATHLRAIQYSADKFGLAREDRQTLSQLDSLRSHEAEDPNKIDPAVAAALRGKKDEEKKDDKDKDKKK